MNVRRSFLKSLVWITCLPMVLLGQVHAMPPLSNNPLFLAGNIPPNVIFTLDDSGSMQWEAMPDGITFFSYLYPRPTGLYGGTDYSNEVPDFNPANSFNALMRSPSNNKVYYNPAVTYSPWSQDDGTPWANAPITCAPHNPQLPGLGCRNLTVNQTVNMTGSNWWFGAGGWYQGNHTFYPAVYYRYNGGAIGSAGSYTEVQIIATTASYSGDGRTSRTDCTAGTCTYAQEIQNFANWYTYYRSRILLARAGAGKAFAAQGSNMRVGFAAINKGNSTVDGVANTRVVIRGVRPFSGTDRTNFFNSLYGHVIPTSGTPLRTALSRVGGYFERTDDQGPWGEFPGIGGGTQHECRQSYNILMTDGYWNDNVSGVGNADGSAGTTITNHSTPATPASYAYSPGAPYADAFSDTLADYAMDYWKRDLRPTLGNRVPTNASDPAFWQHMVTFTVGLGVSGTLAPPPAAPGAWPDPSLGNPEKLDDLWHAAVNSRGDFFSASNPTEFANGLSNSLSDIQARTGSASAVATNSTKLNANGRVYQAKFDNDWSGRLLAYPIDTSGTLGALDWDAGVLINSLAPASRVILTKGASDGVEFQYANLTPAQKAELDKNAGGTTDNCGVARVAYLRGDATNEATTGSFICGGTTVDKFRNRATSKLGDIVNSGPLYVGAPSAGHSDLDHAGYSIFAGTATGYKDRVPMVYVGANDGSLHGFNACVLGVTPGCTTADEGKELVAYVPSMVYGNLTRLTDKNYNANHRYFVDGSPMAADADLGVVGGPSWKSVLVGSMNGGGQGYFALDITNPTDAGKSAPTFTAAKAADLLLWEFTNADDADMGYTHNIPPIDRYTGQAKQIVKMQNGKWAAVLGNGYNSANGKAVLYVLFIKEGEDGVWTSGSDYIKIVADPGTGNGLSTPMPFDSDGDGLADTIYAGDIKGNLWKFDVSNPVASVTNWTVSFGGVPLFSAGTSKPIVSPPVISLHPKGGQLVLFGTGKYLETTDVASVSTQSIYGIWDTGVAVAAGTLVGQTVTRTGSSQVTSLNPVNYEAVNTPLVKGWYLNFPVAGERMTAVPILDDGVFLMNTIIPTASPCDGGGGGFVFALDYLTGQMLSYPAFDTDGDGDVDSNDSLSAGVGIGFAQGGVTPISGSTSTRLIFSKSDGTLGNIPGPPPVNVLGGRINWRELLQ